jgi:hypothetical protein
MARFGAWLRGGRVKPEAEAVARVKGWALALLAAEPETAVTVSEIVCLDPSCPGTETVILVMAAGRKTRAFKVGKPMDEVTEPDVREALIAHGNGD